MCHLTAAPIYRLPRAVLAACLALKYGSGGLHLATSAALAVLLLHVRQPPCASAALCCCASKACNTRCSLRAVSNYWAGSASP